MKDHSRYIDKHLKGQLTKSEQTDLQHWIEEDPKNARQYALEASIDYSLGDLLGERVPDYPIDAGKLSSVPFDRGLEENGPRYTSSPLFYGALAATLLIGAWMYTTMTTPVARLVASVDAAWDTGQAVRPGDLNPDQTCRLQTGLVHIEYSCGAQVVLEGPANFRISSRKELCLDTGKAVALCEAETSHGFTIKTAEGRVVDLGTQFGVEIDQRRGALVYVHQGEVQLFSNAGSSSQTRVLRSGEADTLADDGVMGIANSWSPRFTTLRDFRIANAKALGAIPPRWAPLYKELRNDPDLLVWLDFSDQGTPNASCNLSTHNSDRVNYPIGIETSKLVPGRFPENAAFECNDPTKVPSIRVPGQFRSLTLSAWVRLGEAPDAVHRGLLLSRWRIEGDIHWQVKWDGFRLSYPRGENRHVIYSADFPSPIGSEWRMLTTVFDSSAGIVSHYFDGELIGHEPIEPGAPLLRLGECTIGGWPSDDDPRVLEGAIDDLMVWRRALSGGEVKQIWQTSR